LPTAHHGSIVPGIVELVFGGSQVYGGVAVIGVERESFLTVRNGGLKSTPCGAPFFSPNGWPAMSERSESNGASGTPVKLFVMAIRDFTLKSQLDRLFVRTR
jgi:hypothetical protein